MKGYKMDSYNMTPAQRVDLAVELLNTICELDGARGLDTVVDQIHGSTFSELLAACEEHPDAL